MIKKISKSTWIMIALMSWWISGILIFGDFSKINQWYSLVVSLFVMPFLVQYRWWSDNEERILGPTIFYSLISGIFMGIFGLNPFAVVIREPLIQLTIDNSFSIIGWWVIMSGFLPMCKWYRVRKKSEFESGFDTQEALERQYKIEKIVGKWWKSN